MLPEFYNELGAMHGTIMVFLGVVPLAVGGFGNFVLPLQIGAPDMAFPRLNMTSYWCYFVGGVRHARQLLRARRRGPVGLDLLPAALRHRRRRARRLWLFGMVFLITSSLLGSVNFIVTIIQLRAPGLTFFRLPFFVWAQLVTVVPAAAGVPAARGGGVPAAHGPRAPAPASSCPPAWWSAARSCAATGGGSPLLWQHLFWFLPTPRCTS